MLHCYNSMHTMISVGWVASIAKQCIKHYIKALTLSLLSQVLKKTMYNHLINFIDANKILYKYQFGLRKSHSTNHAIISKVNNAMDSGKISIGVFWI